MKHLIVALALSTALTAPALAQNYRIGDTTAEENGLKVSQPVTITGTRTAKSWIAITTGAPTDTAIPGVDYDPVARVFEVLPTDTKLTFEFQLRNDNQPGPTKTITTKLTILRGGSLLDGTGKVTRTDADKAPAPTPTPTPTPSGLDVAVDGDSISLVTPTWNGYWPGIYASTRPAGTVRSYAVGGSGLADLEARLPTILAAKPKVLAIFPGANDLHASVNGTDYVDREFVYIDKVLAAGIKVAVGTILPNCAVGSQHNFPAKRAAANPRIKQLAAARQNVAVMDFAADPGLGPDSACADAPNALYGDKTHPTDGSFPAGQDAGHPRMARIAKPVIDGLLADHGGHAPPPPSGDVLSPSLAGIPPIPDVFDPALGYAAITWSSTKLYGEGLAPRSDGWDRAGMDGAFRFTAGGDGLLNNDDTIAFHGIKGGSHLHQYFCGNADANATYVSLRTNPNSNCSDPKAPLNPSAYWMPAMLCGQGFSQVCRPEYISIYYKGCSARANSACAPNNPQRRGIKLDFPHGIVLITGWDPAKPNGADGIPDNHEDGNVHNDDDAPGISYYCAPGNGQHYKNLVELFAKGECKFDGTGGFVEDIVFGDCWDGKRLDSANHRDHLTFPTYGSWGYSKCPTTHPYSIPQPQFKPYWTIKPDMVRFENGTAIPLIKCSSDDSRPGAPFGSTCHADWFPAISPVAHTKLHRGCLDKGLDCVAGDFGDGTAMRGAQPSYGWDLVEDRSPIPPRT